MFFEQSKLVCREQVWTQVCRRNANSKATVVGARARRQRLVLVFPSCLLFVFGVSKQVSRQGYSIVKVDHKRKTDLSGYFQDEQSDSSEDGGKRVAKKCRPSPPSGPVNFLSFHLMDMRSKTTLQQFQMDVCKADTTEAIWENLVKIHKTYPNGGAVGGGVKFFTEMNDKTMERSGIVPKGSTIDEVKDLFDKIMVWDNLLFDHPDHPNSMQFVNFMVSIIPGMKERRF